MGESSQLEAPQLLDSLKLIKTWNNAMLVLLDQLEKDLKSESTDVLDGLMDLGGSIIRDSVVAQARCFLLSERMKALRLRRESLIRGRGMKSLPTEIIGYIFNLASCGDHRTTLAITHANSEWRSKALSTPTMWSTVDFSEQTNFSVDMLWMYLERSKDAPLFIEYHAPTSETFQASFPLLVAHGHHWRELSAKVPDEIEAVEAIINGLPYPPTLPKLEGFAIFREVQSESHPSNDSNIPFPRLCLPAIRIFVLPWAYRSIDFSCVGPGLVFISLMDPVSLTGMESCLKLRKFICHVRADLDIEQSLQLHFPFLEEVQLFAHQDSWAVISQLFRAMASSSPTNIDMSIRCWDDGIFDTAPALEPPPAFLAHLEEFTIRVDSLGTCSPLTRINVAKIIERSPMLSTVCISGIPELHLLLHRIVDVFPPNVSDLSLIGGGSGVDIAEEVLKILERRQEKGIKSLEFLHIAQCGLLSEEQVTRLGRLVDQVELDDDEGDGDEDSGE